MTPKLSRFY